MYCEEQFTFGKSRACLALGWLSWNGFQASRASRFME